MVAIFVTGIVAGSLYALAAMGLVVTYRSTGVFNFALGAIGMFVAYCYWWFSVEHGMPMGLALLLSLGVVAPTIGILLERLFRALKGKPTAVPIVASLGIMFFLQNLTVVLFGPGNQRINPIFPTGTVEVAGVQIGYDQFCTIGVVAVTAVALTQFFRRTKVGLRMRAVVDNESLSELSGISANAVSRVAWIVGTVFAGGAGILLSTYIGLDVNTLTLVVITAFSAAMFGRLVSLPLAILGAVILALGENFISFYAEGVLIGLRGSLSFILLFGLLIFYRNRLPKDTKVAVVDMDDQIWHPRGHSRFVVGFGIAAVLLAIPYVVTDKWLFNIDALVVYAVILISLVILTGFSGQISLAHASFVGIGAFTAGHVAVTNVGTLVWAIVLAAAIAAAASLVVGLPSLRLSGLFLALATLAFALMMDKLVFQITEVSGGLTGTEVLSPVIGGVDFFETRPFYFLSIGFLVAFGLFAGALRRSRMGRRLQAMRDSPDALRTLGVSLTSTKLFVFALTAAMAGMGGVLLGMYQANVSYSSFTIFTSVNYLLAGVIGGIGSVPGAVLGAGILAFPGWIQTSSGNLNDYLGLGIGLVVVQMSMYPNGLISYYRSQAKSVSTRIRKMRHVPAKDAADPRPELDPQSLLENDAVSVGGDLSTNADADGIGRQ